jgi:hypothetical protein
LGFPKDDWLLGTTSAFLDFSSRDNTLQHEEVVNWAAEQLGVPFNYRRFIKLYVIGQPRAAPGGAVYEDAQQPDSDLLSEFYPEDADGDLFKLEVWWATNSIPISGSNPNYSATMDTFFRPPAEGSVLNTPRYRWNWLKRAVQNTASDYTSVSNLVVAVGYPASATYAGNVDAVLDSEEWMRVLALRRFVGDADSYGYGPGHNMYAYKPRGSLWRLHNFDIEYAFDSSLRATNEPFFANFGGDPNVTNIIANPQFRRAFWRGMQDLINGPFQITNVSAVMSGNDVALRANGISPASFTNSLGWIALRWGYTTQQLGLVTAPLAFTNSPTSAQPTVLLGGTAPVAIKFLQLNGRGTNELVLWGAVTNWVITNAYTLTTGANLISVTGLDRLTNVAATANITITR